MAAASTRPETLPLMRQFIPFALSTMSGGLVTITLYFTDQRFLLMTLVILIICYIEMIAYVCDRLNWGVSKFIFSSLQFVLGLMVPIYLFQFFGDGFGASPSPEWFEVVAYAIVLVVAILLVVAVMASRTLRSLTAAFGENTTTTGKRGSKIADD